jgi:hypothetical protein
MTKLLPKHQRQLALQEYGCALCSQLLFTAIGKLTPASFGMMSQPALLNNCCG